MNYIITNQSRFTVLFFIHVFIFSCFSYPQSLLNRPESVVYDSLYNRYLVSNWANGCIVQIDRSGAQSYFVTGHGSINGIYISNNIVFAACSLKVKGFDLATKDTVMDLLIPGAINLNDVTADNSGNIYITDFDARKIMRVNIQSHAYSTFVSGLTRRPNGILFDEPNNRLLLCSFGYNIPILAISLEDSSVSVVTNTSLAQCDGFTKDNFGNYYISSWATTSIYKFDFNFTSPPELFYTNSSAPVDISYNCVDDVLAVPLMYANSVVFLPITPTKIDNKEGGAPLKSFELYQNHPNPFNPSTKIKFTIPSVETAQWDVFTTLKVYDVLGNEIATLVNEEKPAGTYEVNFDASGLPSGLYFYKLSLGDLFQTKKMVLIK